jgi:hypothetical protein
MRYPAARLLPLLVLFVALTIWFPKHPSDEHGYVTLAQNLTHAQYTGLGWRPASPFASPDAGNPDLWFGPGLPLVLAPLVAVGAPLQVLRLVGPFVLFAALLMFFRLLRLYVPERPALLGALALGLYFPFYSLLPNLHSEPLAIFLVITGLYSIASYIRTGSIRYGLLGALAIAWLAVTRVEYGWVATLMLAVSIVWWAIDRSATARRLALIYALGLVLCVPWLAFTYSVTDRPFVWGNSGPLSLYWMSSPYSQDLGDWRGGAHEILISDPHLVEHRPFFTELAKLEPIEQNRRLERAALHNIRGHPRKFLENVAANVSRLWFDLPFSDKQENLKTLFYLLPNTLLLGALIMSLALLVQGASTVNRGEALAFATLGGGALLIHAVLAGYPRMLMPIVPIAISLVVCTLSTVARNPDPAGNRAS